MLKQVVNLSCCIYKNEYLEQIRSDKKVFAMTSSSQFECHLLQYNGYGNKLARTNKKHNFFFKSKRDILSNFVNGNLI